MRLFIGIDCEKLKDYFLRYQKKLMKSVEGAAKLKPVSHFHITLKFIGEVTPQTAEKIRQALREISFDGAEITFSKIGHFTPKSIRVIWIGGEENAAINELGKAIEERISKLVPKMKSERDFIPHVTLARVKSVSDKGTVLDFVKGDVEAAEINVRVFKLYQSVLTPEGPIYEVLEEYPISSPSS